MCQYEINAYYVGQAQEETNPYTPFTDAYYMFEKGRRDAAGIDFE